MSHRDLSAEALLLKLNRIDGLDPIKALAGMSGQTALYLKLVNSFAQEQVGRCDELQRLFKQQDWHTLRHRCHSLKSYCAYIGAYEISTLAATAENELSNGPVQAAPIETICQLLEPMLSQIRASVLPLQQAPEKIEFSLLEFKKALIALLPLLQDSDFAAEEALESLKRMTEATEYHQTINIIYEYVDDVEYEQAVEETTRLLEQLV